MLAAAALLLLADPAVPASAAPAGDPDAEIVCRFDDDRLTEISGITWSREHPGVYWLHNDSGGGPYLYAVDGSSCRTLARVRVGGIGARDLEALGTGVDPDGRPVLWLGDIGDNAGSWPEVRLHAVPEPAELVDQQVEAATYRFTYPSRPLDAEALLASPDSPQVWVVTKQLARGAVWRVPLEREGTARAIGPLATVGGLVTDAAYSPDGTRFVLRDYLGARLFDAPPASASVRGGTRVQLPVQPQGEAITFTADGEALLVASEDDTALWRVALPAPSTSPTASAGAGSPSPSTSEPGGAADEGGISGTAAWLVGGVAVLAAVGVAAWATRRRL